MSIAGLNAAAQVQQQQQQQESSHNKEAQANAKEIRKIGESGGKFESPIDLSLPIVTEVSLPSLQWGNAKENARLMKLTNSGKSVILSAKWFGPRPFISKGPLDGYYVFSQAHFHWGSNDNEGSEHTIDGKALPLEIHVMFFKSIYLAQEEALKKSDGVTVVVYLLKVQRDDNLRLKPVIDGLSSITNPYTSYHMGLTALSDFFPLFTDDFFIYWGNVYNNHKVLWIICREPMAVSSEQVAKFRLVLDNTRTPMTNNFRKVKSLNFRKVFHVNPSNQKNAVLYALPNEHNTQVQNEESHHQKKKLSKKSIKKSIKAKKSISKKKVPDKHQTHSYACDFHGLGSQSRGNGDNENYLQTGRPQQRTSTPYLIGNQLQSMDELVERVSDFENKNDVESKSKSNASTRSQSQIESMETKPNSEIRNNEDNVESTKTEQQFETNKIESRKTETKIESEIPILSQVEEFLRNTLHDVEIRKSKLKAQERMKDSEMSIQNEYRDRNKEGNASPKPKDKFIYPVMVERENPPDVDMRLEKEEIKNQNRSPSKISTVNYDYETKAVPWERQIVADDMESKCGKLRPKTASSRNEFVREALETRSSARRSCGSLDRRRAIEPQQERERHTTIKEIFQRKRLPTTNANGLNRNTQKKSDQLPEAQKSKKPVWKY